MGHWEGPEFPVRNPIPKWCAREDLNLHALRHQILSLACLPFHHARIIDLQGLTKSKTDKLDFVPLFVPLLPHETD